MRFLRKWKNWDLRDLAWTGAVVVAIGALIVAMVAGVHVGLWLLAP